MAGAGVHNTTLHLEQQCYVAARSHLEMAETHMESSSLNLETVQTLILIARYEFTRTLATRAIITMARLTQLVRLCELDNLDRRETPSAASQHLQKIQESRNIFWIAYGLHCQSSILFSRCEPIDIETVCAQPYHPDPLSSPTHDAKIHTALPLDRARRLYPPHIFLSEAAIHSQNDVLSPLAIFVLAMRLAAFTEQHHRMTVANVAMLALRVRRTSCALGSARTCRCRG